MKKMISLILITGLLLGTGIPARAETLYGDPDWQVTFTSDLKMESNFRTSALNDAVYGMQPGDTVILSLDLSNQNGSATDWYMTNKVLYSLEDRSNNKDTKGGAYTYRLTYKTPGGTETVLFDSDTVGGENASKAGEGLKEATDSLKDYFYLDTLKKGEKGVITLRIVLDGETQGNDYQNTLADLQMNFAVELNGGGANDTERSRVVRMGGVQTGDVNDMLLYAAIMVGSGTFLLVCALILWRRRRAQEDEL